MFFKNKKHFWLPSKPKDKQSHLKTSTKQNNIERIPNKVGIVMPVYNQEKQYLIECVHAIEQQTYKNFSLVIVIDGANEETVKTVYELSSYLTCDFIIIDRKINKGIAYSLNEGFDKLKDCSYLTWISSDNRQAPNFLEKLVETMNTSPSNTALVYSMYSPIDENGMPHPSTPYFYPALYKMMNRSKEEIMMVSFIGASFLYTREAFEKTGGYDSKYDLVSDYEFWIRLMKQGEFVFIPEPLMEYRLNGKHSLTTLTPPEELYLNSMSASLEHRTKNGDIPKVSVIITAHNHGNFIKKCLQSVFDQTFKNFHVIVVDVGSTDNTLEEIYSLHDTRTIPIHIKQRTKADALNIALDYVLGEYVLELDGDDWIEPITLEVMISEMDNLSSKVGMVFANRRLWYEENGVLVEGDIYKGSPLKDKYKILESFQTHCPRMYRYSALKELSGWMTTLRGEPLIAEDFMMFLRVAERFKVHWIDQTLYNQRRHNKNITIIQKENLNKQFRMVVDEMLIRWGDSYKANFEESDGYITKIKLEKRRKGDRQ
ncbi:glycosyltransferase [Psychrobacillus sp. AK 1817]|uniref:glycosyltransferase family 2 protein n=1 Tax=Psychrobacillus sp. AK 1817 TaxID=2303505 RepID=UPI001246B4A2|nr:glycosyltransferase [Psychrobacillus sp. AK 1817]QEY19585.1 glycosyltransferase [Psychrobacillus sp. AK 1817]